jgi:hypothetical protein
MKSLFLIVFSSNSYNQYLQHSSKQDVKLKLKLMLGKFETWYIHDRNQVYVVMLF